jgi:hypothetical protein
MGGEAVLRGCFLIFSSFREKQPSHPTSPPTLLPGAVDFLANFVVILISWRAKSVHHAKEFLL